MDFWKRFWEESFSVPKYRLVLHLIFWAVYFLVFSFWDYYLLSFVGREGQVLAIALVLSMFINVIVITASYYLAILTAYGLLVRKHQYGRFFLMLFVNILFFCLILSGGRILGDKLMGLMGVSDAPEKAIAAQGFDTGFWQIAQMVISYFALLCLPVASKFFRDQFRYQTRERALEKQNTQLQMDFLKAQIHPHFLFNTLNNIYSLSLNARSEKASEMISRLSDLLRYVLYKAKGEYISIKEELAMIRDFIELEAIRSDNLDIRIGIPAEVNADIFIPPFLLLPLVENAFKHGANSQLDKAFIQIGLTVENDFLLLEVSNSFDPDYRKRSVGGLGLPSLRKRLQYYYSNQFALATKEQNRRFDASLKLPVVCPKFNV